MREGKEKEHGGEEGSGDTEHVPYILRLFFNASAGVTPIQLKFLLVIPVPILQEKNMVLVWNR